MGLLLMIWWCRRNACRFSCIFFPKKMFILLSVFHHKKRSGGGGGWFSPPPSSTLRIVLDTFSKIRPIVTSHMPFCLCMSAPKFLTSVIRYKTLKYYFFHWLFGVDIIYTCTLLDDAALIVQSFIGSNVICLVCALTATCISWQISFIFCSNFVWRCP